jgi:hypothetical protein
MLIKKTITAMFIISAPLFSATQDDVSLEQVSKAVELILSDTKEYQVKTDKAILESSAELVKLKEETAQLKKQLADLNKAPSSRKFVVEDMNTVKNPVYKAISNLNVRKNPTLNAPIAYVLQFDKTVNVAMVKNNMGFIGDGWCSMDYLKPINKDNN